MKNILIEFDKNEKMITSLFTKHYRTDWVQNEEGSDVRVVQLDALNMLLGKKIEANDYQIDAFKEAIQRQLIELGVVNEYRYADLYVANAKIEGTTKEEVMSMYNKIHGLIHAIWEWFLSILDKFEELFPKEPVEPTVDPYEDIEPLDLFPMDPAEEFFEKTVRKTDNSEIIVLLYENTIALTLKKENATPNEIVILADLLKSFITTDSNSNASAISQEYEYNGYVVIQGADKDQMESAYDGFINRI